jgi:hypothetical protein
MERGSEGIALIQPRDSIPQNSGLFRLSKIGYVTVRVLSNISYLSIWPNVLTMLTFKSPDRPKSRATISWVPALCLAPTRRALFQPTTNILSPLAVDGIGDVPHWHQTMQCHGGHGWLHNDARDVTRSAGRRVFQRRVFQCRLGCGWNQYHQR